MMFRLWSLTSYLIICFCPIRSLSPSMPECHFDYRRLERPYIYAVSKSPVNVYHVFGKHDEIISPLSVKESKGNFGSHDTFCRVPKTGVYAIFLQINVARISPRSTSVHSIAVGKVSESFHSVHEFIVANRNLPSSFTGSAFCANLTTLEQNDLLFVKHDSRIEIAWQGEQIPIQLVSYMVSPKVT